MDPETVGERGREKVGSRRLVRGLLVPLVMVLGLVALVVWWMAPPANPLVRAESEHGIHLPPSATDIQCRGDAWHGFLDRGAFTMFEMNQGDLAEFEGQLKVFSRELPARTGHVDPVVNGWNVWPVGAKTFVPGNAEIGGFERTWSGDAVPLEMLSCASPEGDWLHVEFWKLPESAVLVKMYTDWN